MNREICGECLDPVELCKCFDIFTHAQWCGHCKFNVDAKTHHETCEYAALKKEVEELREENSRMLEILRASYAPKPWVRD